MARKALLALGDITDAASSPPSPLPHEYIPSASDPFALPWAAAFAPRLPAGGEEGGEERRLEKTAAVVALAGLVRDPCPGPQS